MQAERATQGGYNSGAVIGSGTFGDGLVMLSCAKSGSFFIFVVVVARTALSA
jgi:hypothetical protein